MAGLGSLIDPVEPRDFVAEMAAAFARHQEKAVAVEPVKQVEKPLLDKES